ncbi:uncharacterized protein LOC143293990 [Babylonia areolata]|uniref:uncharacterized protein LOC143293990 n=1 Tax=Babylonia areolata TaxID=304850 RepID=UPI003FD14560
MAAIFSEPTSTRELNVTDVLLNSTQKTDPSDCMVLTFEEFIPWDNPDNLISAETVVILRRISESLSVPLFLFGGPANLINMAVFYKQGLKERINVCLFSLSLSDFLYLTIIVFLHGEQIYKQFITEEAYGVVFRFIANHNMIGFYGLTWVSEVISAIIACERCFCIMQPLRSQTVLSTSTTTIIIVLVNVMVVGLYFVVGARYRIVCAYDPTTNRDVWIVASSKFFLDNQNVIGFFDSYVYGIAIPMVSIVVVVVTTTLTLLKLRQAAAWRAGTSSSGIVSAREVALTMMLVYNSIFFTVCVSPIALFRVVWPFIPEINPGRRHHNMFFAGLWVLDAMSYINATFNIVVYYSMGSRYRQTFWQLLGKANKKDHNRKNCSDVENWWKF